jgi:hypothetical protein
MHNANLHDRLYPFGIRFGSCRDRLPTDDERVQPCPQTSNNFSRETILNLSSVKQRSVLLPRKIEAAEVRAIECDTGNQ